MKHLVTSIDVKSYTPHWLHSSTNHWPQSNCYVDLWIEILHTLHVNPLACFAFTLSIDFEGDQWTFFKFPIHDLFLLYGIDVQELNIWNALLPQICEQTGRDRLTLVEVDAFYLPDVSDTNYHRMHEKTTIGIQSIDPEARELHYFHNSGYYSLQGEDFDGIFHPDAQAGRTAVLPPYVEFAKFDRLQRHADQELSTLALELLRGYSRRIPSANPFTTYSQHFQAHLAALPDLQAYHQYAFATLRQYGACYAYASLFLQWLADYQGAHFKEAAAHLEAISSGTQVFLLRAARVVRNKKPLDHLPYFEEMAMHWDQAMQHILANLT
ncbi:hypothetical protein KSD_88780 [Ktedonobacter sp. SOSP1-85]|uniref:DUF1839 family protein n=1 Tax=Ktedonobacter sp. SOSP1-85 TaxID=2778367 RepID=UPI001915B49E|nr:DUF1839 family protein [Ktedonobacter sp. SOSP1-85]GHO81107.1 hypothetical protein KSD_88780 [Ktedonobacter sp. SOSP1-85]